MIEEVKAARQHLLELVSMYSDEMMEFLLAEESLPLALVDRVIREAVLSQQLTPVFLGSAYKNKGVQPLLDAVTRYLPSPLESPIKALAHDDPRKEVPLTPDPGKPMVGMAFKIVEDSYGTLTFMRMYQGTHPEGRKLLQPAQRPQGALQPDRADARRSARRHRYRPRPATSSPSWDSTRPAATPIARSTPIARWKACSCPSRSSRWRLPRPSATAPTV